MKPKIATKKTKIEYSLEIYSENDKKTLSHLYNLESLPRFEVGDHFDDYFFNPLCDLGWRAIVTDAIYFWSGTAAKPKLMLRVKIRDDEDGTAQSKRLSKHGIREH